jgi:hypothetical protein
MRGRWKRLDTPASTHPRHGEGKGEGEERGRTIHTSPHRDGMVFSCPLSVSSSPGELTAWQ